MILVAGLGNLLRGDDGVASRAIEAMERETWPDDVEFADLGTPGLGLASLLADWDALILVDAVQAGEGCAGEVRRYGKEQLLAMATDRGLDPHDPSIAGTLRCLEAIGMGPREAVLIGVVVQECELGVGLTPAVEAALPEVTRMVREEIAKARPGPGRCLHHSEARVGG